MNVGQYNFQTANVKVIFAIFIVFVLMLAHIICTKTGISIQHISTVRHLLVVIKKPQEPFDNGNKNI